MKIIKWLVLSLVLGLLTVNTAAQTSDTLYKKILIHNTELEDRYKDDPEGWKKYLQLQFKNIDKILKDKDSVTFKKAFYGGGMDIYFRQPSSIDVTLAMATVGFDDAVAQRLDRDISSYVVVCAKSALDQMENGKASQTGFYGAYSYNYKNSKYPDTKSNAAGWMNYIIGYVLHHVQNEKAAAVPYFYKATQFDSGTKSNPSIYQAIGSHYVNEIIRLDQKRVTKIKAAGDVDTDAIKAMLTLQKNYAGYAAGAYARAYQLTNGDAQNKAYKDGLLARAKEIYAIRFENDPKGFDAFLAQILNKPFPPLIPFTEDEAEPAEEEASGEATDNEQR